MADLNTITTYLEYNPEVIWMGLGAVLLVLEVSAVPGIGLLFAGLASMTLGGLLAFGVISAETSVYLQLAYFFGLTCIWTAVLWKPFMKMRSKSNSYHNMIGTHATVIEGGLQKGKTGKVKWSGTPMHARIAEGSAITQFEDGAEVWVHALENSVLVVAESRPQASKE